MKFHGDRSKAPDGYKLVTLCIPEHQRLGQAIMNAYRDRWNRFSDDIGAGLNIWEETHADIANKLDKL